MTRAPPPGVRARLARAALVAVAAVTLASCRPPAPTPTAPAHAWEGLTPPERLEAMRERVTPRMRALFVAEDPHRYARFTCATCHGRDGPARAYRMPNPDLLLEPTPWNTAASPDPARAPSARDAFMARVVAPELARLLGRPGAGCFACHAREE